jgi:hypothetical protein
MGKSFFGHRNGSPDAEDILTPARVAEIGGSIPLSQVQEFRRIPNALPSVFPPAVVTGLSVATSQSGQLVISWSAPSDNGGSAVTGYILTGTNGTSNNAATSPVTISGLEDGNPYTFSVAAVNAIGTGLFSSVVGTSVNSPPAAPTNVVATAGNATATVTWTAPANTGGSAIQSYTVNCSDGQSQTVEGTTATFGVTNGVAITFTVSASNTASSGPFSAASAAVTPAAVTAPGAPTALSATAGNQQIVLAWTAPASNGGAAIIDYSVDYSSNSGSSWTTFGASQTTSRTITGLTNGTSYIVRVAARNSVGYGGYVTSGSVTPAAPAAGLSVVSGSPSGEGTVASPYLVASAEFPSPVYKATGPGQFRISYTAARTYEVCDKGNCTTYRHNDAVFFDRTAGTFYEKMRSNLGAGFYDGNNRAGEPRNQSLLMTAAAYMGQKMQPRGDSNSSQFQYPTARIAFQPQDANFSISSIGSRPVFGNGTAEEPFVTQTAYYPDRNVRSVVFRANGSGVVCISTNLSFSEAEGLWFGGTASSFTGGGLRSRDSYQSYNQYGIFPGPSFHFVWVNDGEIFSLASVQTEKSESWVREKDTTIRPVMAWAAPTASQTGLFLMNYGQAFNASNPTNGNWGAHLHANSPTFWTGLGTAASPLNMPTWSQSAPHIGHTQNLYASRDGTFTFDFQTFEQRCEKAGCTWEPPAVVKSLQHGMTSTNAHGIYSFLTPHNYFAHTNGAGSGSFSVRAFTGVNFVGPSDRSIAFRITNLIFTPS